jgi:tetratricopeptide (TPR) repeat protein
VQAEPDKAAAQYVAGVLLLQQGQTDRAVMHLTEAVRLAPDRAPFHQDLGVALAKQNRWGNAVAHWREAIRLDPDIALAHQRLREAESTMAKLVVLAEAHRKALQSNPDSADDHYQLAGALAVLGEVDEATEHFRRMLELEPDRIPARNTFVNFLLREGRLAEAIEQLRELVLRAPDNVPATLRLAQLLATCDDPAMRNGREAIRLAERAAEKTSHANPTVLDLLAAAHAEVGEFDQAREIAGRAHDLALAAGNRPLAHAIATRQQLYGQGKPFHQPIPGVATARTQPADPSTQPAD